MKKVVSISLTMALIASLMFVMPINVSATAYSVTTDSSWNWSYNTSTSSQSVTLSGYKGTDVDLTATEFPQGLDNNWFKTQTGGGDISGYEVGNEVTPGSGIYAIEGISAFDKQQAGYTLMESVELPYGPRTLGGQAFRGQTHIDNVYLPDSMTSVGTNAFSGCSDLDYLVLSANLATITGTTAFQGMQIGTTPTKLYFRNPVAPTLTTGGMMWTAQKLEVYYPASCTPEQIQAFKSLVWFGKVATGSTQQDMIDANITFSPYNFTDLPADAQAYYNGIGSGNTVEPSPEPSIEPSPEPSPVPSPVADEITGIALSNASGSTETVADATTVDSVSLTSISSASGVLIVGVYATIDGNPRLIAANEVPVTAASYANMAATLPINLTIPSGAVKVKAFFWNSRTDIKPLMSSISK